MPDRIGNETLLEVLHAAGVCLFRWEVATDGWWWSAACYPLLGYENDAVAPSRDAFFGRVHPDDLLEVEGVLEAAERGESDVQALFRVPQPDGRTRWIEIFARALRDADGTVVLVAGVWMDVSARVRSEEDRRESEWRFRRLYEANLLGVVFYHESGRLLAPNEAFLTMIGVDRAAFDRDGLDWGRLTPVEWTAADHRAAEELRARGRHDPREKELLHHSGHRVPVLITAAELVPGRPEHGVAFIVDLSRLKRVENALRDNEARLLALNETLEQRVRERTAEAEQRADQLRALALQLTRAEAQERERLGHVLHDHVQQLVSAARLKAGIVRRDPGNLRAPELLRDVETLLEESLTASRSLATQLSPPVLRDGAMADALEWLARRMERDHNLTVTLDLDPSVDPEGEEIRSFTFEATRELLFNVVKHAGTRAASMRLDMTADAMVRIAVSDSGRGFDARDELPATRGGLGLRGLRQRMMLVGGRVDVRSAPGEGTTVTLLAPMGVHGRRRRGGGLGASQELPAWRPRREAGAALRVLIADDHRMFREGISTLLAQDHDFDVVGEAADGEEALHLAHALRPDVVLLDISMPGRNGIQVTEQLGRELPGIKVVGLSMHERDELGVAMRQAGAVAYVSKMGPSEVLLGVLRSVSDDVR
jgi:PAS domain S-box-containing protein